MDNFNDSQAKHFVRLTPSTHKLLEDIRKVYTASGRTATQSQVIHTALALLAKRQARKERQP